MTVNHDVVGSSPTGGVSKRFLPLFIFSDRYNGDKVFYSLIDEL